MGNGPHNDGVLSDLRAEAERIAGTKPPGFAGDGDTRRLWAVREAMRVALGAAMERCGDVDILSMNDDSDALACADRIAALLDSLNE